MARPLVVEGETLSVVADSSDSAGVLAPGPVGYGRRHPCLCSGLIAWPQRVLKEQMLYIGEEELLVLLLVLKAKLDHAEQLAALGNARGREQVRHPGIDMTTVRHDLVE